MSVFNYVTFMDVTSEKSAAPEFFNGRRVSLEQKQYMLLLEDWKWNNPPKRAGILIHNLAFLLNTNVDFGQCPSPFPNTEVGAAISVSLI